MKKLQCIECSSYALKQIDIRRYRSECKRLYECGICKERFETEEAFTKKCNSLELNNRKYRSN